MSRGLLQTGLVLLAIWLTGILTLFLVVLPDVDRWVPRANHFSSLRAAALYFLGLAIGPPVLLFLLAWLGDLAGDK
jgi:hypothetical protein